MIILTGVGGKLGHLIAEHLLRLVPPDRIAASTREVAKAGWLTERGIRVRYGDYGDPASLRSAFEGGSQLLLVSSNAAASGGDPLAQHRNAIEAAEAVGINRIVYTSHMGASATSAFPPMHTHAATEAMLAQSGLAWTALRNGFYASMVTMLIGDAADSGILRAPADGKVSWTAHDDLAAAAAAILAGDMAVEGPTPPLTGAEALDLSGIAAMLSRDERRVERSVIGDEEYATSLRSRGLPEAAIAISLGLFRAARDGEFAAVDPTLARLIGRPPTPLAAVLGR